MNTIAIVGDLFNPHTEYFEQKIIDRGWQIVDAFIADAFFVLRGWREYCYDEVRGLMESRASLYWEPNLPPDLTVPDFATVSGVKWENVTRPIDSRKGRQRFQHGGPIAETFKVVQTAVDCGHKVTAKLSQYSPTIIVATIHANGKRTFHLKLWASNETQARNALEDISILEMQT